MQAVPGWSILPFGWGKSVNSTSNRDLLGTLDTVCRVALALFAYAIEPVWFTFSFVLGASAGLLYTISTGGNQAYGSLKPLCGLGYMEFLSNEKFPTSIAHLVTAAFIAEHIRHDPAFFVPFTALFVGWWTGSAAGAALWNAGRQVAAIPRDLKSCCS